MEFICLCWEDRIEKPPTRSLYLHLFCYSDTRGARELSQHLSTCIVRPAAALWDLKEHTDWSTARSSTGSLPYLLAFLSQGWGAVSRQPPLQLQPERKKALHDEFPPASNTLYLLPISCALSHSPGTEHFPFVLSYLGNKEMPRVTCQYDLCELGKSCLM